MQPEGGVLFNWGVGGIAGEGERCVEGGNWRLMKESTTLTILTGENGILREENEDLRARFLSVLNNDGLIHVQGHWETGKLADQVVYKNNAKLWVRTPPMSAMYTC